MTDALTAPALRPKRPRHASGVVLFPVLLVALVGCASPGGSGLSAEADRTGSPAIPSLAPASVLAAAVERLRPAYEFQATVTVEGKVVTSSTGRTVGGASQVTVQSSGREVEYVQVPPDAWARPAGGGWVLIDATVAAAGPLDALAQPIAVESVPQAGPDGAVLLRARYTAKALGLTDDGEAVVEIAIQADGSVALRWQGQLGDQTVVSMTTARPTTSPEPIRPP